MGPYGMKGKETVRSQVLLNGGEPFGNMLEAGSSVKGQKVWVCRVCEMMMAATTENKD